MSEQLQPNNEKGFKTEILSFSDKNSIRRNKETAELDRHLSYAAAR